MHLGDKARLSLQAALSASAPSQPRHAPKRPRRQYRRHRRREKRMYFACFHRPKATATATERGQKRRPPPSTECPKMFDPPGGTGLYFLLTLRGFGRPRIRPKDPCLELRPKGIRKAPKGGVQKVVPPVTLERYGRGTCRPVQFQAGPSILTPKDGPNGAWAKPDSVSAQPRGHAAFQRRFSAGTACFTAD